MTVGDTEFDECREVLTQLFEGIETRRDRDREEKRKEKKKHLIFSLMRELLAGFLSLSYTSF